MILVGTGRRIVFTAGVMAAGATWLMMGVIEASAYTPEQEQACTGDAMRLCGAFIPDVDRITACMISNKAQLSPVYRAHFVSPPETARPMRVRTTKPVDIRAKPARKPVRRQAAR
jgi:hypothetical protein